MGLFDNLFGRNQLISPLASSGTAFNNKSGVPTSTGGFSSQSGHSLLVTPSGSAVGTNSTPTYTPRSGGQVLGATTIGSVPSQAPSNSQQLLEPVPEAPRDSDFDAIVNGAFNALNEAEGAIRSGYDSNLSQIDSHSQGLKSDLQAASQQQLGGLQNQRVREQGRADSAIAESRRLASQLQQGVQARFGGSTSAGGAVSEILGGQAIQSIAGLRQSLQETLGQIETAEQNVRAEEARQLSQIEREMLSLKQQAQSDFRSQLANIAQQRSEIESKKATAKLNALENYRNQVAAINARNLDYQRAIQARAANAASQVAQFKNQAQNRFEAYLQDPKNAFSAIQNGLVSPDTVTRLNSLPYGFIQQQQTDNQEAEDDDLTNIINSALEG